MILFLSVTTKCSPSCTPWMLALKGTGNISAHHTSILSQPTPWDPVMFPMAHCWQEGVRARRKRDQKKTKQEKNQTNQETETWLDVTYLLSNLNEQSWGRTGGVHFVSTTGNVSSVDQYDIHILKKRRKKRKNKSHPGATQACPCIINPWFYCCKGLCL